MPNITADWHPLLAAAGTILGVLLTFYGTIYVARTKSKTDINASINAGFQALTDQLQQERSDLNAIIDRQREVIDKHREMIEKLFTEGDELRVRRRDMQRRIDDLEQRLRNAGLPVPDILLG